MRRALTLIELLIALPLGAMILVAAATTLRVAAQATAQAERLALENRLARAGYAEAMRSADFWDDIDDRSATSPARRRLRADAGGRGLPFAPMRAVWPPSGRDDGDRENDGGWDADDAWAANDPRTWFRGNLIERYKPPAEQEKTWFGHYELFAHQDDAVEFTDGDAFGAAEPTHRWLPAQLDGVRNALGYYGVCDYLPSATLWGAPPRRARDGTDQGWAREWCGYAGYDRPYAFRFTSEEGGCLFPRTLFGHTNNTAYAIAPGTPGTTLATEPLARLIAANHGYQPVGQYATTTHIGDFQRATMASAELMPLRPSHWPRIATSVTRMIAWRRHIASCRVRWTSPLDGATRELSFSVATTTLRGARQQRRLAEDPSSPDHALDLDGGRIDERARVRLDLR